VQLPTSGRCAAPPGLNDNFMNRNGKVHAAFGGQLSNLRARKRGRRKSVTASCRLLAAIVKIFNLSIESHNDWCDGLRRYRSGLVLWKIHWIET
jgi:hypothetical protein